MPIKRKQTVADLSNKRRNRQERAASGPNLAGQQTKMNWDWLQRLKKSENKLKLQMMISDEIFYLPNISFRRRLNKTVRRLNTDKNSTQM